MTLPQTEKIYGDDTLNIWVVFILYALNAMTAIATICNLFYLWYIFYRLKNNGWTIAIESTRNKNTISSQSYVYRYSYRRNITIYFYFISVIPFFVSMGCHYGAHFPKESIWIFPFMNITIAIAYLLFMRMMIISCDGWQIVKYQLINENDECHSCKNRPIYRYCCKRCFCKLCLQKNAFQGLKQRMFLVCLIIIKPMVNYGTAYFEYDYGDSYQQHNISYVLQGLTVITTFVPQQSMRSFHCALQAYTRLRRSVIKRKFVAFLGPICQIQEILVGFVFNVWHWSEFGDIENKYDWICAYGILLCTEMMIISFLITSVAFNPHDLALWQYTETFIKEDAGSIQQKKSVVVNET